MYSFLECSQLCSKRSNQHVRELIKRYRPELIFLFETHVPFAGSSCFWEREGYKCVAVEETQGQSGDVWVLANKSSLAVFNVIYSMPQCITLEIVSGSVSWACSAVYASPNFSLRCNLWDHLSNLRRSISVPWVMIGNFNDVSLPSEQRGGIFSHMRAGRFAQMMSNCEMLDLDFFGSKFTWQRKCRGNTVSKRLDRGICDDRWRLRFPEATIEHLTRCQSDHNPLLLRCSNTTSSRQWRPFRFQAAWYTHKDYSGVVSEAWRQAQGDVVSALHNVSRDSLVFNNEIFGNIWEKKRQLEARLRGIQRALEGIDSANLLR